MPSLHNAVVLSVMGGMIPLATLNNDPTAPASNFVVRRSTAAVFTADGLKGADYVDAEDMLNLNGGGSAYMEAKLFLRRYREPTTGAEELRIYFSIHDIQSSDQDRLDLYFDRRHDHGTLGNSTLMEDVRLRIFRPVGGNCIGAACTIQRFTRGGGTGTGLFDTPAPITIANAEVRPSETGEYAAGWTGELRLAPADLGWGYFPATVGFLAVAQSANQNPIAGGGGPTNPRSWWPSTSDGDELVPDNWGHLKLRYPLNYALVLDYSGSMLALDGMADNRWVRAKRAADLFAATAALLRDPILADSISISQYSWTCGNQSSAANLTGAVPSVSALRSPIPTSPYSGTSALTAANMTSPPDNNCTPIKEGLDHALTTQLDYTLGGPEVSAKRDRIVALMSDGLHNMPAVDVPFDPNSPATYSAEQKAFTQVRTVAMGPDMSIGTDLLSSIATVFHGGVAYTYVGRYNQVGTFPELLNAYIETFQDALTINQVPELGGTFSPGSGTGDHLVFVGVWDDAANASNIKVQHGADPEITGTISNTKIGYAAVVVTNPPAGGNWTFTGVTGMGGPPDHRFVLIDPRVLARFLVEQRQYSAGEPILLRVSLLDRDIPVLNAQVTVDAVTPGEGLGNFLSRGIDKCKPSQPGGDSINVTGGARISTNALAVGTGPGDPLSGRHALAAALAARCKITDLGQDSLPGERLYDDGTHGDVVPGDGVYSLLFTKTNKEGSHNLRFLVRGTTSDGMTFTRTRVMSEYIRITPAAAATSASLQTTSASGGVQTANVLILPKDNLGNFLGPGFADQFFVHILGGQLVGPLVDLNNGYYRQTIQYSQRGPKPTLTFSLPGASYNQTVGFGLKLPALLLCWILVLLLLLLLVWMWRTRRTAP